MFLLKIIWTIKLFCFFLSQIILRKSLSQENFKNTGSCDSSINFNRNEMLSYVERGDEDSDWGDEIMHGVSGTCFYGT